LEGLHQARSIGTLADFTHPQSVAQAGASLGQSPGGFFPVGQAQFWFDKLALRPILSGELVTGDHRHPQGFHVREKFRRMTEGKADEGATFYSTLPNTDLE